MDEVIEKKYILINKMVRVVTFDNMFYSGLVDFEDDNAVHVQDRDGLVIINKRDAKRIEIKH